MEKYEATFDSLRSAPCPDWFRDVKFGIWSHWGPQSVPMFGDWYARNMYIQGTPQYQYHVRHYGHPSKFGYKDICALWKAENFEPEKLMELYHRAGARYFVSQAMHHDHFFNYDSALNRMNSVKVGPGKDICALWKAAADKYRMPFGLTEHLSASFSWWRTNKGADSYGPYKGVPYDGNDPEYKDFYFDNYEHVDSNLEPASPWYTGNKRFHEYWRAAMYEMIDKFTPDLLYSDGSLPFGEHWYEAQSEFDSNSEAYECGLDVVARLYNVSATKYGQNRAVYTQKDKRAEVYNVGVLDVEKSQLPDIAPNPWQTDTCIGNWFYDVRQAYKKPDQIIEMLVDIVAKNGTMLLNILQRPDGSIDDEALFILQELAKWFDVCSEGVYGTRPWKISGEGNTRVLIKQFHEEKTIWNTSDFRFTQKGGVLYAFMLCAPENGAAVIRSLSSGEHVKKVRLLGCGSVPFAHEFGVLTVKLPDKMPTQYANCLAIEL